MKKLFWFFIIAFWCYQTFLYAYFHTRAYILIKQRDIYDDSCNKYYNLRDQIMYRKYVDLYNDQVTQLEVIVEKTK